MSPSPMIAVIAFVMTSSLVMMVALLATGRRSRLEARLRDLSGEIGTSLDQLNMIDLARTALPKVGHVILPSDEKERTQLTTRLIQAGFYSRQAMPIFLGVKLLMIIAPMLAGAAAGSSGLLVGYEGLLLGASLGICGVIGPSFWLDSRKHKRQTTFRRSLPDALDVLVICLEGGLSLPGALRKVAEELRTAHPALAMELNIVQREIQLGHPPGEALQRMGERLDLEEVRSLAAVIVQADRYGAGLVKSLRVHADTLRIKRQQRAEELAQKATIKLIFPTLLLIFPAIFVVILGPAAIHLTEIMGSMQPH